MVKRILASILLVVSGLVSGSLIGTAIADEGRVRVRIPICQEDETFLKGKGDFDGAKWARYVCVHPDNL